MNHETWIARFIVVGTILTVIVYDTVFCGFLGWKSITSQIRWANDQTDGLICYFWLAVWLHLFFFRFWLK